MIKALIVLLLIVSTSSVRAEDQHIVSDKETGIIPGTEVDTNLNELYAIKTIPVQVATHPKVLDGISVLREKLAAAITTAKEQNAELTYTDGVITTETWSRAIPNGAQKFWIFTARYRAYTEETFPGEETVVAHLAAGSYVKYKDKLVFPLHSKPYQNLPFLGTFPVADGEFKLPKTDSAKPTEDLPKARQ